jgi:molybdate transport system ATP-binding protein
LLAVEGLRHGYGSRVVVDIESLVLHAGEVLAILGPNGAGKSTLFRLLLLLERPDAGTIMLAGRPVRKRNAAVRRQLAGVFQRPYLFDGTVEDNLAFGVRTRRGSRRERRKRIAAALTWFGLEELARAPVRTLSGGEAQRVALARAVAIEPDVLLLDEPTANLDVTVQRRFRQDLEHVVRQHTRAAILITHDPVDAFALADRIILLEAGRIVQAGTPSEITLEPATPFAAAFAGAELLLDGVVLEIDDNLVTARVGGGALIRALQRAQDAWPLRAGDRVHVAYRPEDITLAQPGDALETSAINRYDVTVVGVHPVEALMRVRLGGPIDLAALVTRRSAAALGLAQGKRVQAQLKATAARAFAAPSREGQ